MRVGGCITISLPWKSGKPCITLFIATLICSFVWTSSWRESSRRFCGLGKLSSSWVCLCNSEVQGSRWCGCLWGLPEPRGAHPVCALPVCLPCTSRQDTESHESWSVRSLLVSCLSFQLFSETVTSEGFTWGRCLIYCQTWLPIFSPGENSKPHE